MQLSNAQSNEEYTSDSVMIPANTSLIVRRVPVKNRGKKFEAPAARAPPPAMAAAAAASAVQPNGPAVALPLLAGSMTEQDRMDAIMAQTGAGAWTPGQAMPQRPKFMQGSCLYALLPVKCMVIIVDARSCFI